ncbi:MAG: hypothetical protein V2J26_08515 [Pacificimonas sp.]|jgi:hypothetical protein|nr:hypothetical protein [Pacificimonas sp.]
MPTENDKATSADAVAKPGIPGETAQTGASVPAKATTVHPVLAEHQDDTTGQGGQGGTDGPVTSSRVPKAVREQANKLAGEATEKARSAAVEGKAKASETVHSLAASTRDAAKQFEGTQAEPLSEYITNAADSIEKIANSLDEKSVDDLVDDFREMVRRTPAIAIGAAAAVGFAISRFAKATERADGIDADPRTPTTGTDA